MKWYRHPLFWTCVLFFLGSFVGRACATSLPDATAGRWAWIQVWLVGFTLHIMMGLRQLGYGEISLIAGEIAGFMIMNTRTPVMPFISTPYDAFALGAIIAGTVLLSILFNAKFLSLFQRFDSSM